MASKKDIPMTGKRETATVDRVTRKMTKVDREVRRQFGQRLKGRRGELGYTQLQFAELVGQQYFTFISQVENGVAKIPTDDLGLWADVLGLDPYEFAKAYLKAVDGGLYKALFNNDPTIL